ncbi:neuropeptide FF receptor 2 [Folsomia candida]|uniref:Neuropeptide FF receptor 2 n=1 Tax=Folsomia candida TaxID=158441 RepID=A0A226EKJ1_FOLCA|nr:neuropeptide FF receptor 2 [Folsomia candida]OXA57810.1 Neuropeptide FF receptor 2 [Folsomia candida]
MRDIWFEVNTTAFHNGNVSINDILEEFTWDHHYLYHHPENIFLIAIYLPVFLIALIANIFVIAVFIKYRSFRTVTNCFLLNLSCADLLVSLICMPAAVGQAIHSAWLFGDFICKASHYMQGVAVGASVFTLTAMSLDRYLAIRHPLKRKNFVTKKLTLKVIFFIWVISLSMFSPILYVRRTDGFRFLTHDFVFCLEEWSNSITQRLFGSVVFVVVYALPGIIMVVAYALMGCTLREVHLFPEMNDDTRQVQIYTLATINLMKERRKVARTLMVLAIVFAFCWLPSSVLGLILDYTAPSSSTKPGTSTSETSEYDLYIKLHRFLILLGHANSSINPFLYCLTRNFRNLAKDWYHSVRR